MSGRTGFAEIADRANQSPERRARIATMTRALDDALAIAGLVDRFESGPNGTEAVVDLIRAERPAEGAEDLFLATLQHYVADLGGRLVVEAVFPGVRVNLLRAAGASSSLQTVIAGERSGTQDGTSG